MTNVVSFAAFVNDRRAAVQTAARDAARAERRAADEAARAAEMAALLGGSPEAQILGALVAKVGSDQEAKDEARRYMPAYCDPANEVRGSKYDATRDLNTTDIAARIRADIKAAIKAKTIPACKISVRSQYYSGGSSIDVRVNAVPEGFRVTSDAFASWKKQFPQTWKDCPGHWEDHQSEELRALKRHLTSIVAAYNRDNSDGMVDYFDVRFHSSVEIDWQLRDRLQAAEVAASPGTHWVPECGA